MSSSAADAVVLLHLAFIVFAVGGGLLFWWRRWLAWLHLPALAWAALVSLAGWPCPLTPLENQLRAEAGETVYGGSFVEHHIVPVVYPTDYTRGMQIAAAVALVAVNGAIYGLPLCWRARRLCVRGPSD